MREKWDVPLPTLSHPAPASNLKWDARMPMSWGMRLSIGAKLAAAFGAVLAIAFAVGLFGLHEIRTVNRQAREINHRIVPGVEQIDAATRAIEIFRQDQFRHLSAVDRAGVDADLVADRA